MEEILHQILEPVLHELKATGAPYPRLEELDSADDPDQIRVMLWQADGSGAGALASRSDTYFEQVASIADHAQVWVQESSRAMSTRIGRRALDTPRLIRWNRSYGQTRPCGTVHATKRSSSPLGP